MSNWKDISTAPKDGTQILAWCNHDADSYTYDGGKILTPYGTYCELLTRCADGIQVIQYIEGESDINELSGEWFKWPDWWFTVWSEGEEAANPTHWMPLPEPPEVV